MLFAPQRTATRADDGRRERTTTRGAAG